jgi:hypothetical protein
VIASRAVNSSRSSFDAVWMTCSTATRTTRHYEAVAVVGPANNMLTSGTRSDYLGGDGQNEVVR